MTQTADGYMRKYAAKEAEQAESARQSRTAKIADALGYIEEQLPEEILEVLSVSGVGGYDPSAVGVANSRVVVSGAVTLEIGGPRDTEEVPLKVTGPIGGAGSIKASYDSNHAVELRGGPGDAAREHNDLALGSLFTRLRDGVIAHREKEREGEEKLEDDIQRERFSPTVEAAGRVLREAEQIKHLPRDRKDRLVSMARDRLQACTEQQAERERAAAQAERLAEREKARAVELAAEYQSVLEDYNDSCERRARQIARSSHRGFDAYRVRVALAAPDPDCGECYADTEERVTLGDPLSNEWVDELTASGEVLRMRFGHVVSVQALTLDAPTTDEPESYFRSIRCGPRWINLPPRTDEQPAVPDPPASFEAFLRERGVHVEALPTEVRRAAEDDNVHWIASGAEGSAPGYTDLPF